MTAPKRTPHEPQRVYSVALPRDFAKLKTMRESFAAWMATTPLTESSRANVVLATHEAAANAMEHAGSSSPIVVNATSLGDDVSVEITDHGRWREPARPDDERGRGLKLMASLVSALEIETDNRGTIVRLHQGRGPG